MHNILLSICICLIFSILDVFSKVNNLLILNIIKISIILIYSMFNLYVSKKNLKKFNFLAETLPIVVLIFYTISLKYISKEYLNICLVSFILFPIYLDKFKYTSDKIKNFTLILSYTMFLIYSLYVNIDINNKIFIISLISVVYIIILDIFETNSSKKLLVEDEKNEENILSIPKIKYVENQMDLMFEQNQDVMWFISKDESIKYISPSIKEFLGYEPEDLLNSKVISILTNESYMDFKKSVEILNNDKYKIHCVYKYKTKGGLIKYGEAIFKTYYNKKYGEGYFGTTREITQEKALSITRTDDEFIKMKSQIHELTQDKKYLHEEVQNLSKKIIKMSEADDRYKTFPISKVSELIDLNLNKINEVNNKISNQNKNTVYIMKKMKNNELLVDELRDYLYYSYNEFELLKKDFGIIKNEFEFYSLLFKNSNLELNFIEKQTFNLNEMIENILLEFKVTLKKFENIISFSADNKLKDINENLNIIYIIIKTLIMNILDKVYIKNNIKNSTINLITLKNENLTIFEINFVSSKVYDINTNVKFINYVENNSTDTLEFLLVSINELLKKTTDVIYEYEYEKNMKLNRIKLIFLNK